MQYNELDRRISAKQKVLNALKDFERELQSWREATYRDALPLLFLRDLKQALIVQDSEKT